MELSLLCDVKVFLFLYDKQSCNKLLHFQSDADDDFVAYLFKDCCNPKNFYSNQNVRKQAFLYVDISLSFPIVCEPREQESLTTRLS